ncbi:MAG: hypothetical protein JW818_03435 [Pirellulales bacterium]|nr:hypothetical protein [Pirellulales bacterium]
MRKTAWISMVLVGLLAFGLPVTAMGSVFTAGLSYNDVMDVIQDNSVSTAIFDNGDGVYSQGDVIFGIVKWNISISDPGTTFANTAVTVFSAMVMDNGTTGIGRTVGSDPGINFSLGATPIGSGLSVAELLPSHLIGAGPTVAATLSGTNAADPTQVSPAAALAALNAAPWTLDGTLGLLPGVNTQGGVDFFEIDVRDRQGPGGDGIFYTADDTGPDGFISITDTDGDGWVDEWDDFNGPGTGLVMIPGTPTGYEAGAFSVLVNNFAPYGLWGVPATGLGGNTTPADVAILPSTAVVVATDAQVKSGWQFADNSFAALNPKVPEPASILIWGCLAGLGACLGFWRRTKN